MNDNWDFLISEFCRLGGIAENICQKEGQFGRGIFSVNPSLKSKIFTPSHLMVKNDDIVLENNKLRIKEDKEYNTEIRNFFNFYQDNFSWGSGGRETTELFEKGLNAFSPNLKALIKKYALIDLEERHKGTWDNVVKKEFLNSRQIQFRSNVIIAPIWELVNHKVRSSPFIITEEGISTPNYPPTNAEIRQSYSNVSPLNRFFYYGFYSEESIVFSMPFLISNQELGIHISCQGLALKDDSMKVERSGNEIILEGLPIADLNHPRLPYDYFEEIVRKIGNTNLPHNILDTIFKLNIQIRKKIIDESNLINNEVSKTLTKILLYEINLISSHN